MTTYDKDPVIGFDMVNRKIPFFESKLCVQGGTSTDVSRYAGHYEQVYETVTAGESARAIVISLSYSPKTHILGVTIQAPQLDVNTVAAGGGSRLFFRSGLFVVGPESSGAHPGPVCYRKNGYLSITDANLFLGKILKYFTSLFV